MFRLLLSENINTMEMHDREEERNEQLQELQLQMMDK